MTMSFWTDSRKNILNHPPIRSSGHDFGDDRDDGGDVDDDYNDGLRDD